MKNWRCGCLLVFFSSLPSLGLSENSATKVSPLGKVVELLAHLMEQTVTEADEAEEAYHKFEMYCADRAGTANHEVKTQTQEKSKLEAIIAKCSTELAGAEANVEQLTTSISVNQKKLKDEKTRRENDEEDFEKADENLVKSIDMLDRAMDILQHEMERSEAAHSVASLLQTSFATEEFQSIVTGLAVVMQGAGWMSQKMEKLTSLMQQAQDAKERQGVAMAVKVKGKPTESVMRVLEDLKDEGQDMLKEMRDKETAAGRTYQMIKTSLEQEVEQAEIDLTRNKNDATEAKGDKAQAEGELEPVERTLKSATDQLARTQTECQETAADHEMSVAGRKKELEVLKEAKTAVQKAMNTMLIQKKAASDQQTQPPEDEEAQQAEDTSSAESSPTFLQLRGRMSRRSSMAARARMSTRMVAKEVVQVVSRLAQKSKSEDLAQLASRVSAALRYRSHQPKVSPFVRVKQLIRDMIVKMEREMKDDQTEKDYCDKEKKDSYDKRDELDDLQDELITRIDQAKAQSTDFKTEIADISATLSDEVAAFKDLTNVRTAQHTAYKDITTKLKLQLDSLRSALKTLKDYYAAEEAAAASSAASFLQTDESMDEDTEQPEPPNSQEKKTNGALGIIGMIETVEADVAQELNEEETQEADSQAAYDKARHMHDASKASKDGDIKFMTKQYKTLDNEVEQKEADLQTTKEELVAVAKYMEELKERCNTKATLAETQAAHEAEIKGLEEAKEILSNTAATWTIEDPLTR